MLAAGPRYHAVAPRDIAAWITSFVHAGMDRLIWASDGPQSPGFPASYRDRMVAELKKQLFTKEQIKSILAGNFYRIFNL